MTAPTDSGKPDPDAKPAATPVPPRGGKKKPNRPSAPRAAASAKTAAGKAGADKAAAGPAGAGPAGTGTAASRTATPRAAAGRGGAPTGAGATKATGAGKAAGARPGTKTSNNRRQAEWQARRKRNLTLSAVAVGVVVIVVAVFIVVKTTGGSSGNKNASTVDPTKAATGKLTAAQAGLSALPASWTKVRDVPIAALAAASKGTTIPTLTGGSNISKQPPLVANGHPEVLYIGAGFCPFCAAERWAMVAALSKFGTFNNLSSAASSGTDTNPFTPTFSFYLSTFSSPYVTFTPVETTTNDESVALQSVTSAQNKLWKALDSNQTIPFIDFGNKYRISGATYTSTSMANQSFDSVAAQVGNNNTTVGKGIDQAAGAMVKAICALTDNQPANVCSAIGS